MVEYVDIDIESDLVSEPVSLTEVKSYLHIDFTEDDNLLSIMIKAARKRLERYTGVSFGSKVITAYIKTIAKYPTELPYGPAVTISSVSLWDENAYNVTEEYYVVGTDFKKIVVYTDGLYKVNYTTNWTVPEDIKLAIMAEVAYRYENRGDDNVGTLSTQAKDLAHPYRRLNTVL